MDQHAMAFFFIIASAAVLMAWTCVEQFQESRRRRSDSDRYRKLREEWEDKHYPLNK